MSRLEYKVLRMLKSTEVKPSLLVTPVLEHVEGGYRTHHVDVMECFHTRRFVPIEHVGNQRRRILDLEDENAKLWELCGRFSEYVSHDRCEGCVCKSRCDDGEIEECWQLTEIRGLARELGIEVAE